MKKIITLLLLITSLEISAQDWKIINSTYRYNFSLNTENIISITIWVDSVKSNGDDSIFFLNRVVEKCNNCSINNLDNSEYEIFNKPLFLQEKVIKSNSIYSFSTPNNFVIKSKAEIGDKWLFDTAYNIEAKIVNKSTIYIFQLKDSIKTIVLSSNDTIIISKLFGIIRFDVPYDLKGYLLEGIDHKYGASVPNFFDIYNFSVGDIFEYHGTSLSNIDGPAISNTCYDEKDKILTKKILNDSIVYDISVISLYSQFCCPVELKCSSSRAFKAKWIFINKTNCIENLFNNELISLDKYGLDKHNCKNYSIVRISKNSKNIYTKTLGSSDSMDFYNISDTFHNILKKQICIENEEFRYNDGLGLVYHSDGSFEAGSTYELIGYKKGNDTVGILLDDNKLILSSVYIENNDVEIFPNPTKNDIWIKNNDKQKINQIIISDLKGMILYTGMESKTISLTNFKPGIYIIEIRLEKSIIKRKIIKNAS